MGDQRPFKLSDHVGTLFNSEVLPHSLYTFVPCKWKPDVCQVKKKILKKGLHILYNFKHFQVLKKSTAQYLIFIHIVIDTADIIAIL